MLFGVINSFFVFFVLFSFLLTPISALPQGPCNNTVSAPVEWPAYRDNSSNPVTNTLLIDSGNATGLPPSAPIHVVHNHRDDKCALYVGVTVVFAFP